MTTSEIRTLHSLDRRSPTGATVEELRRLVEDDLWEWRSSTTPAVPPAVRGREA